MAYRLALEAETDLDDIWLYTSQESGDVGIADRLIDSIANRLFLLATHPYVGRPRDADLYRPGAAQLSNRPLCDFLSRHR